MSFPEPPNPIRTRIKSWEPRWPPPRPPLNTWFTFSPPMVHGRGVHAPRRQHCPIYDHPDHHCKTEHQRINTKAHRILGRPRSQKMEGQKIPITPDIQSITSLAKEIIHSNRYTFKNHSFISKYHSFSNHNFIVVSQFSSWTCVFGSKEVAITWI